MFYFGLLDVFGLVKIKAFGEDAEKFYPLVKDLDFFPLNTLVLSWPKIPITFFLVKNLCSFFIFLFPLDVEVIVYKAGSVTDCSQW